MRAEVRSVHLVGYDNWNYWPDDSGDFCVAVEVMVGVQGEDGEEIFSFEVCSPRWFERNRGAKGDFVRHVLLINEYDECAVKGTVEELVNNASGNSWSEIANWLARYMFWEFEDYKA